MTSDQRRNLIEVINQERDRLLAGGSATKYELWDLVGQEHRDLIAAWSDDLVRGHGLHLCHKSLVATVRPEEMQLLPGFGEDRRTYTVPEGRIYRHYRESIQARVDQARADFTIAQRLAEEARQRFGVDIDPSGEDE
jgi:hypothetical protein